MLKKIFLLFIPVLFSINVFSQNLPYAKSIIDTLSSISFYGRGYVNKGDSLASELIKSEFEKIGLEKLNNQYFQVYKHNVNTFPGKISLTLNEQELRGGSQFLIDPASKSGEGKYKTLNITLDEIIQNNWLEKISKSKKKALTVDLSGLPQKSALEQKKILEFVHLLKFEKDIPAKSVVLYQSGKQPWYISDHLANRTVFTVFSDSININPKQITFIVENEFKENYRSKNVIGYLPGKIDSAIVITAHFDHLGMMGHDLYFPGANDNASGTALLLDLATYFIDNPIDYSLYFIGFSGEEAGLKGSRYFVEHPTFPLEKIKFLLNIDLAGTGIDGATVVNGQIFEKDFQKLLDINEENNYLKAIKSRGEACNSDHCFFYQKGVKCFFIYTLGGTIYYHDIFDSSDTLVLNEYNNYFRLLRDFIKGI